MGDSIPGIKSIQIGEIIFMPCICRIHNASALSREQPQVPLACSTKQLVILDIAELSQMVVPRDGRSAVELRWVNTFFENVFLHVFLVPCG